MLLTLYKQEEDFTLCKILFNLLCLLVTPLGFKPGTSRSLVKCSIQLSDGAMFYSFLNCECKDRHFGRTDKIFTGEIFIFNSC